jgi:peptidyl-prolyl cis-trans isomerase B (cyclophilin B)
VTDTTPPARPRPGNDVIAAVVLAFALVVGAATALALTGDDTDSLAAPGATASADPFATEPAAAPTDPGQPPATQQPPTQPGTCAYPKSADEAAKDVGVPPVKPLEVGGKQAVMDTTAGSITLTLSPSAPCTTSSFAYLADEGYFDDTPCHRLVTEGIYVLQCGDPSGQGNGGPGYTLPDEALQGATYPAGTVAMANTGAPGSGGSQFFLVYEDSQLPPTYTPWAKVTGGLDVLKAIAAAGSEPAGDGAPKTQVVIKGVSIS